MLKKIIRLNISFQYFYARVLDMSRRIILSIAFSSICLLIFGQEKITREEYILKYAGLAMEEMLRTGIPASITLAQGCLESDNGNSRLARDAKNHFGIKCHDWEGRKIRHDDDERNECFRKYRSEKESYLDHSDFLTGKNRYAFLFELQPDDYKGWARGLKEAGYATSSSYATLLIAIIEENELYRYDQQVIDRIIAEGEPGQGTLPASDGRTILTNNRVEYIIIKSGDSYESLRDELKLYPGEIYWYNDIPRGHPLDSGMVIYLQPKRCRAEKGNNIHVLSEGEDMWTVSQFYAVKLKRLYRMNTIPVGSEVEPGTELWLRKRKPMESSPKIREGRPEDEPKKEDREGPPIQLEFDEL